MNKAYDILLNFKSEAVLPFYEWNETDKVMHVQKLSFIKIDSEIWQDIKHYQGSLDLSMLKEDLIVPLNKERITLLLTSDKGVMGVLINEKGKILKKSGLLLDEERELMELNNVVEESKIGFKKGEKLSYNYELTLQENELLIAYKKDLKAKTRHEKLKFWYYEICNKEESDIEKVINYLNSIDDLDLIKRLTTINS